MDLIGVGAGGMMEALDRFEPARGVKFSTYAITWISMRIRDFALRDGVIQTPMMWTTHNSLKEQTKERALAARSVAFFSAMKGDEGSGIPVKRSRISRLPIRSPKPPMPIALGQ